MENFIELLKEQYNTYPDMPFFDMVKFIYQNEFGCGHFISQEALSLRRITEELKRLSSRSSSKSKLEYIGNNFYRLHLYPAAVNGPLLPQTINNIFIQSSLKAKPGNAENFSKKLNIFLECCKENIFPYCPSDVEKYISDYKKEGFPPVSHSDSFKKLYDPAYRVISGAFARYMDIFEAIDYALKNKSRTVVAIEGKCASGKTTLASYIEDVYGEKCSVIHTDHFFLPPKLRTPERLLEIGGNIHYERFYQEVVKNITRGESFSYGEFDCSKMCIRQAVSIKNTPVTVIEGAYCLHPEFGDYSDINVFLDIDPREQKERILKRNGPQMLKRFEQEWIPMENLYFSHTGAAEKCQFKFNVSAWPKVYQ